MRSGGRREVSSPVRASRVGPMHVAVRLVTRLNRVKGEKVLKNRRSDKVGTEDTDIHEVYILKINKPPRCV